ncbi:MAG: ROK family protein [Acidipropionibacterium sp.]|nr:ROK family protein [Acidipropionibacterium sp.]
MSRTTCAAWSRWSGGSASGVTSGSFIMVTLGQGLGTCVVDHGHAVTGASGAAGLSQWTQTFDADGVPRPGGSLLTTPAVLDRCTAAGLPRDPELLIRLAESGDARALEVAGWTAGRLAPLLATMVNLTDPELILLGGELSPLLTPVVDDLAADLVGLVAPFQSHIPIHIADWDLGDWARGAAVIALQELLRT